MGDLTVSNLIPLGGSVVLMTLLLKMWAAERVRWIRERDEMIANHHAERKELMEEHEAEIKRRDELCERRIAFWRDVAEHKKDNDE